MDVKELIEKVVKQVSENKDVKNLFQKEPIKAVEKVLGVDLPNDLVEKIVAGVKAKIASDGLADALGSLKTLF